MCASTITVYALWSTVNLSYWYQTGGTDPLCVLIIASSFVYKYMQIQ